jgi:PIN domain nuclease of toxin-antitoxin system
VSRFALDASAVLAMLRNEPGADVVAALLPDAVVSSVNFAEIITKLVDRGSTDEAFDEALRSLNLQVVAFAPETAYLAGLLRRQTRSRGLSLGDRACLALAIERGLTAVTADAAWVGAAAAPVQLIRPA